jgi:hypothetical protein
MIRLRCAVPGCRRTRGQRKGEPPISEGEKWLCGPHWKLIDRRLKAYRTKRLRMIYRVWEMANAACEARLAEIAPARAADDDVAWGLAAARSKAARRWRRTKDLIWRRMTRQAIERAAGI